MLTVFIKRSRPRANEIVRPDKVGFARRAEPLLLPAAVTGDDLVNLVVRQLRHQHADDLASVDNRRGHERNGCATGWRVGCEILEADRRSIGSFGTSDNGRGDVGATVRTEL
ncbi:hypothetical protein D9M68_284480 [compost metagenome]